MKHLYKVEFEIKYSGIGEWIGDEVIHVVANGDGLKAVAAARKVALKKEFTDGDGSLRRAINARLVGLEQLQQIDSL
jgi:hypothetical protein